MHKEDNYRKLFEDFTRLTIMVIGDVMVDSYLWGRVERISPEAPVPIVTLKNRENRMGGAANVARNLKAMGANPLLCSIIGNDEKGDAFISLLNEEAIETKGIFRSKSRITTTKFRIFGNNTQMIRVDEEMEDDLNETELKGLLGLITSILSEQKIDCIVFQDYNKGTLCPALVKEVISVARNSGIPVTVDPKKKNFEAFSGVTLFKPNLKELKDGMKIEVDLTDRSALIDSTQILREKLNCEYVLTTLSEYGVMVSFKENSEEKTIYIPAHRRSIADVSGAGDTVITVASLCLAMKCSPFDIAFISNLAGGLVCEEVGVVPIDKNKLLKEALALL
ncbi:MAG: bifunctional ADP-heptose synthase [Bacteroidetes bacterium]|nr:bifunctional ADP-heptose synthase [Bacteroidota bacterium]